ncbi:MAG: hypothetical protein NC331_05030 [Lachnospiraceae bacterium]|nr:hypothetical protein [Lachnospiraceae bacterium]MCM1238729.1 hypothetical protein [Lachnospiraceae bacterium]
MSKRMAAILRMLVSFVFVLFSFVIVSMNGVVNGQTKFYETFFVFNENYIDDKLLINIATGIFFVAFLVFIMSGLLLYKKKKIIFSLNTIFNILGFILTMFFCQQQSYIFMMICVCACVTINLISVSVNGTKKQSNIVVVILAFVIAFINILELSEHLIISMQWKLCGVNNLILERVIENSTTNAVFFSLYFMLCLILFFQEKRINKKFRRI